MVVVRAHAAKTKVRAAPLGESCNWLCRWKHRNFLGNKGFHACKSVTVEVKGSTHYADVSLKRGPGYLSDLSHSLGHAFRSRSVTGLRGLGWQASEQKRAMFLPSPPLRGLPFLGLRWPKIAAGWQRASQDTGATGYFLMSPNTTWSFIEPRFALSPEGGKVNKTDKVSASRSLFSSGNMEPVFFLIGEGQQADVRSLDFVQKSKVRRKPLGSPSMDMAWCAYV